MTTSDGFKTLLTRIAPLQTELDAAERHIATIRARLAEAYHLKGFVRAGSYSRGTFIRGSSDVDLFAVVARDDARWGRGYMGSETMLNNFRRELAGRFPSTDVSRDVHAIVVRFSDCQVDVVPSFFAGMTSDNYPMYAIPDGRGDWMTTSPARHNAYIRQANEASRGKLRGTAQLLKFWRECRQPPVPISSFHIEMVLASEGTCRGIKTYAECLTEVLQGLAQRDCRGLQDPLGISGLLPAVKSAARREPALISVKYSRDHAKTAVLADKRGDFGEAHRQWNIVFRDCFPKS